MQNCQFKLRFDTYNQSQKLWGKPLFGQFCVSLPFPLLTMLRKNERSLRQELLWVRNVVRGRGGILNAQKKKKKMYKKNKEEVRCMLLQITQMCFNESDCVTLHSLMRIMTENSAKMTQKLPQ